MSTAIPNCELCGEPMPKGEEMFNYHGYSGPCPKPLFGASLDNPFPCSELFTFSAMDSSLRVVYQVSEAVGA